MAEAYDAIIVGAGIAGAGLAAALADDMHILLLEQEEQPGYHTTGRSAAFYAQSYGGPAIQPLTAASGPFLAAPPPAFSDRPFLHDRGALYLYGQGQEAAANTMMAGMERIEGAAMLGEESVREKAPDVRWAALSGAVYDPTCADLDVAGLHQAYLRYLKSKGVTFSASARFQRASRQGTRWRVETSVGEFECDILINAAGAWGDEVAEACGVAPIGLIPMRRTALTVAPPQGAVADRRGPVVLDIEETCYFRPEGDGFLISPADETPSPPCDSQPEELDIAVAIDRFETYTNLSVTRVLSRWAGLRTFAPHRLPVIGFDADTPGFFWSVGQGGWGIQTSPAWSSLAAQMIAKPAAVFPSVDLDPTAYQVRRASAPA